MWVEYFKKSTSSSTTTTSSTNNQSSEGVDNHPNCILCGQSFSHNELCIGMNSVVGMESLFPYHPRRSLSKVLNSGVCSFDSATLTTANSKPCYLHLDCFIPQIHRPFQCMFDYEEKGPIEKEHQQELSQLIVKWQAMRRNANAKKKRKNKEQEKKKKEMLEKSSKIEDEDDESSFLVDEEDSHKPQKKKSKTFKSGAKTSSKMLEVSNQESTGRIQTRLQRKKKEQEKKEASKMEEDEEKDLNTSSLGEATTHPDSSFTLMTVASSSTENSERRVSELSEQSEESSASSPYLLGLSDEIWNEILQYLPFDTLLQLSQVSRTMFYYSEMNSLWEALCVKFLCPNARHVQKTYFPQLSNDFKTLFRKLYENCCIQCGEYLRLDVELDRSLSLAQSKGSIHVPSHPDYYHYLVDHCVCGKCQTSSAFSTISKTEAKRIFYVNDRDFNSLRCMKSPNPFHRSTAMFKFLKAPLQRIHNKNVEQVVKGFYIFSKVHSQQDFLKIIELAKHGKFGKDCKLYQLLNCSTKQEVTSNAICGYIDTLELSE
ncbi:hypothetical protein C9374_011161 [Naegleria lovaniensis]|uniref:F-box domain-containing protein n=1 Tax=Naegleria lovaniensis TaxID=51637 RepID=A0AA88GEE7_NAELO|nr:uncharacterized protein C9374_011161 [Naegleria lovaniensis]KAG2374082.1 hypothetical protein C9374_011161 [Naegleria lovaniensis]